jgi:predicted DNA-binding transcriptional regulator AlpA
MTAKIKSEAGERLLDKAEVTTRTRTSYPTLWKWMREGKFPRSRENSGGKALWLESEITSWIQGLPVRRLKGDDEAA